MPGPYLREIADMMLAATDAKIKHITDELAAITAAIDLAFPRSVSLENERNLRQYELRLLTVERQVYWEHSNQNDSELRTIGERG